MCDVGEKVEKKSAELLYLAVIVAEAVGGLGWLSGTCQQALKAYC